MSTFHGFSLEALDDLIENLQAGVVIGSRAEGILLCNRQAAELLGVSREDVLGAKAGHAIWHFVREDGSPMPPDEYPANRVHETGQNVEGQVIGIDRPAQGDRVWTLVHAMPWFGAGGRIEHVVVTYKDITQRKLAEQALEESEARHRALFDNSPDGILIADPTTATFRFANRTIGRFLGCRPRDLVGLSLKDIHPADSLAHVRECFDALQSGRLDVATDVPCLRKDGTVVFCDVQSHEIEFGGRAYLVGRFLDLTDRQRAERALLESAALRASEDRYRAVVEDQTEIICRFRADGTYTFVNEVFCRLFGKSSGELVGAKWQPQAVAEDVPLIEERLRMQSPQNPVAVVENRVTTCTGEVRWMQFVNRAFYDADGRIQEIQSVGRDISDRKQVDTELAEYRDHLEELARQRALLLIQSEDRYRGLVDASPDAIFVHAEGRVLFANPAAAVIFRAPGPDALIGRSLLDFVHPDYRELVRQRIQDAYRNGTVARRIEERIIGMDGTEVDVDVETVPVVDDGRSAALSVMRDITAQKRLEQEMRNSQKLESVGLLAGGIAHDFNNMLSAILGNISLARLESPGSPEIEKRLIQAERAVSRAISLTQQLLTFARGGAPIRHATLLRSLLVDTADFALRGSTVDCRYDIADDLWAADVDAGQVSQVIQNMVINGQQAMPTGGTLHIEARNFEALGGADGRLQPGPYVRVAIRDSGIGILPAHKDRIFDPYFTTKAKGSGLGLAVCHSIVRQHGGIIEVESILGRGTTFILYLPAARGPVPESHVPERRHLPGVQELRILLMDDDTNLLFALSGVLEALGYRTDTAVDGHDALEKYARALDSGRRYDGVILDLTIPGGMGGKEAVALLLALDPSARVIVSSGYSQDPVMANFTAHGFRGVLPKPCPVDRVAEVLRQVITDGGPLPS